jgi:hypothetical protein
MRPATRDALLHLRLASPDRDRRAAATVALLTEDQLARFGDRLRARFEREPAAWAATCALLSERRRHVPDIEAAAVALLGFAPSGPSTSSSPTEDESQVAAAPTARAADEDEDEEDDSPAPVRIVLGAEKLLAMDGDPVVTGIILAAGKRPAATPKRPAARTKKPKPPAEPEPAFRYVGTTPLLSTGLTYCMHCRERVRDGACACVCGACHAGRPQCACPAFAADRGPTLWAAASAAGADRAAVAAWRGWVRKAFLRELTGHVTFPPRYILEAMVTSTHATYGRCALCALPSPKSLNANLCEPCRTSGPISALRKAP